MSKNKMKLTDANNKSFEVSISDITDMTTDLEGDFKDHKIADAEEHMLSGFEPKIVDSEGKEVDVSKLLDNENKDSMPKAIDVLFEATHSGANRNSFIYHSESMEKDTHTWKTPFARPFLKNHDLASEPLGRVQDAYFGKSELNPDRDCINVSYRISDKDAIEKFLDGRYRTMSIGGSVGSISCNICGKDILKDGIFKFCGHWRGETYANQKALWSGRDIEYKEGSVVNNPADDWAQVKRITVINSDTKDSAKNTEQKDGEEMDSAKDILDSEIDVLDDIDALAALEDDKKTEDDKESEDKKEVTPEDNEKSEDDKEEVEEEKAEDTQTEDEPKDTELDDAKKEIESLKEQVSALDSEKSGLKESVDKYLGEIKDLKDNVRTLTELNEASVKDSEASRRKSIQLAVMHKKLLAQRAVDFEIISGSLEDASKEDRLDELIRKSSKDLSGIVDNLALTTVKKQRDIADKITNPGLANLDENQSLGNEGEEIEDDKTYMDFEESIMSIITR